LRRPARFAGLLALLALSRASASDAAPARADGLNLELPLSETSWLGAGALGGRSFRLSAEPWLPLLERFVEPYRNYTPEWRTLYRGAYGPAHQRWVPELNWSLAACEPREPEPDLAPPPAWGFSLSLRPLGPPRSARPSLAGLLALPEPEVLPVVRARQCHPARAPRPVRFFRGAGESDRFALLDCEGGVSADALDRLSVLARPLGVARPELPLPLEPVATNGEWVSEVRLLHPRLVWVVAKIAESFPGERIEIVSGYRRADHGGLHGKGHALDLSPPGVDKEAVFAVCRKLHDTGCGYYPESRFVHLDVRPHGSGHVAWVDASLPGEPSRYVDGWPGVLSPRSARRLGL